MMSRKDYELIAAALREAREQSASLVPQGDAKAAEQWLKQHSTTVACVARALRGTNQRFDEGRFMNACDR